MQNPNDDLQKSDIHWKEHSNYVFPEIKLRGLVDRSEATQFPFWKYLFPNFRYIIFAVYMVTNSKQKM